MPRPRRSNAARRLAADLIAVGQDLHDVYPAVGQQPAPGSKPITPENVATVPDPQPMRVNARRAAMGLPEYSPQQSIEIAAHLLGPEHCGRFVEVQRPRLAVTRGGQETPGEYRPAGAIAGRLVGYQPGIASRGPNTGSPVKSFELMLQQGPHITTATVSWADPIRIA